MPGASRLILESFLSSAAALTTPAADGIAASGCVGPPDDRALHTGPMPLLRSVAVVLLTTALAVSGCAHEDDGRAGVTPTASATPTFEFTVPPPVPGIHLSFIQQRFEEGSRRAGITVINNGHRLLDVRGIALDWPGYPGGAQPYRYRVPVGLRVDLPFRLPPPRCDTAVLDVPARAQVTTRAGRVRRLVDAEGIRFLHRIWAGACGSELLARAADLSYAGPWRDVEHAGREALLVSVVLTRTGSRDPVRLTSVLGSPLFGLVLGRPRTLAGEARRVAVPLYIESGGRCDPHTRSSVTTPFTFRLSAVVGEGAQAVTRIVEPERRDQVRMLAWLDDVCAAR